MPAFEPTDEHRRLVRMMAGFGVPQPDIATQLEIDPKTLRKYFRRELDRGTVEANVKVAQSLFQMATSGKNVAAAIFWMKARGGWREKSQIEHDVRERYVISATPLSDEELMRIAASGSEDEPEEDAPETEPTASARVVNQCADMTPKEWVAKYGSRDRADPADGFNLSEPGEAP